MLGDKFDKYMLFSPNIFIDPQYRALIDYVKKTTWQKEEQFCFEEFDQSALRELMEDQKKLILVQKIMVAPLLQLVD